MKKIQLRSSYLILVKLLFYFSVIFFGNYSSAAETSTIEKKNESEIIVTHKNILIYIDKSKEKKINDIADENFSSIPEEIDFDHSKSYWTRFSIKNTLDVDQQIYITPRSRWNKVESYVKKGSSLLRLTDSGFFRSTYTTFHDSVLKDNIDFKSKYPIYLIKAGDEIEVISRLTFYKSLPPKSFSFSVKNHAAYLEKRKFDLHLQGLLSGILIALLILSVYTYFSFKNKTNLLYSIWLFVAILSCLNMPVHGNQNLSELYFNFGDFEYFGMNSSLFFSIIFNYSQIFLFVLFAKSFLAIKENNIKINNYINYILFFLIINAFITQLWTPISPVYFFLLHTFFIFIIYFYLLYIAHDQYRQGSVISKYFFFALSAYVLFRINVILAVMGINSPVSNFEFNRFAIFISDGRIFQLISMTLEGIFMSLVIVARSKIVQEKLNQNIQTQVLEAQRQKEFLKKTVKERTSELETKTKMLEDVSSKIAKYIPPQIHEAFFAGKHDTNIATKRRKLTVFFSDIKNFTSISENLQPEDLTKFLNEYFSEMTKIALSKGGTIDKYIGDAMMVFFGDPETKGEKNDAIACVEMALLMQEKMKNLRKKWLNEGFAEPFEIRIGINTGYCNVGNFGSDQRLTYTIIGGEVNIAQRLESISTVNGIYLSYETYAHVKDLVEVDQKDSLSMKGINRDIKIYSIKGRKVTKQNTKSEEKSKLRINEVKTLGVIEREIEKLKVNYSNEIEKLKSELLRIKKKKT